MEKLERIAKKIEWNKPEMLENSGSPIASIGEKTEIGERVFWRADLMFQPRQLIAYELDMSKERGRRN